ncbi:MAG: septum formation initiator family protein [Deltaproteobacteria bacterium]|nr:septum formation initiator family protein [Deltaproteobacteria bacterium]
MARCKRAKRGLVYVLSALLVTLSLFTVFGERGALHLWRLGQEQKRLEERNFVLQKENEILRERIYRLRHDDRYLERIAREELNLVRPGEIIYRFADAESKRDRNKPITGGLSQSLPSWERKPRR